MYILYMYYGLRLGSKWHAKRLCEHSKLPDFYQEVVNVGRIWNTILKVFKTLNIYGTLKFIVLFHYIPSKYMNLGKTQTEALYLIFLTPNPGLSGLHHRCRRSHNEMDRLWIGGRKKALKEYEKHHSHRNEIEPLSNKSLNHEN